MTISFTHLGKGPEWIDVGSTETLVSDSKGEGVFRVAIFRIFFNSDRVWFYNFSTRLECGFTTSPLVSSAVLVDFGLGLNIELVKLFCNHFLYLLNRDPLQIQIDLYQKTHSKRVEKIRIRTNGYWKVIYDFRYVVDAPDNR